MKFNDIDNISTVNFISRSVPGDVSQPSVLIYQVGCNRPQIIWGEALQALEGPPYPTGPHDLVVGYRVVSDLTCHLVLGWPLPEALIDLFVEFRNQTNGLVPVDECTLPRVLELSGLAGYQSGEGRIQQLIDGGENLGGR